MAVLGVLIMMGEVLVKLLIGLILVTGDKIALLLVLPIAAVIIVVTTRLVAVLATSFTEVLVSTAVLAPELLDPLVAVP